MACWVRHYGEGLGAHFRSVLMGLSQCFCSLLSISPRGLGSTLRQRFAYVRDDVKLPPRAQTQWSLERFETKLVEEGDGVTPR